MLREVDLEAHGFRTRREERDGVVGRERIDRVEVLRRDPKRNPARDHQPQPGAVAGELRHVGGRRDDLLEVVEHEQHLPLGEQRDDAVADGALLRLLHVERGGEGGEELGSLQHVGEADERHAVGELRLEPVAELRHQARLAHAARACDRHHPVPMHEVGELRQLAIAAEEVRCSGCGSAARSATRASPFPSSVDRSGTTRPAPAIA